VIGHTGLPAAIASRCYQKVTVFRHGAIRAHRLMVLVGRRLFCRFYTAQDDARGTTYTPGFPAGELHEQ
jgi:hypothetical protein